MAQPQLKRAELFRPELVSTIFNEVKGQSALVRLSNQDAVKFNGNDYFTFNFDTEVDIVAEAGAKSHGGIGVSAVTMRPIKVEYGARVTDEFLYASEEDRLDILSNFKLGFSRKVAKAIDLMAIHGLNPRTGEAAEVIGNNAFVKAVKTKVAPGADGNVTIGTAVTTVMANDGDVTGIAAAPALATELAKVEGLEALSWGGNPGTVRGLDYQMSKNVANGTDLQGIVGDFRNAFKWGFAKDITFEVIQYGDPDNTGRDLAGHNEAYLRCEAYIGWAIVRPESFVLIEASV